jgi:YidC/Oxa1 family membrane protein insertase
MDRKSITIVLFCLVALVGWNLLVNKLYPPKPAPPASTNVVTSAESALATNAPAPDQMTNGVPLATPGTQSPSALVVDTNTPEQLVVVTNQNVRYTFTSHGGGLKQVELVGASTRKERETGHVPILNWHAPTPAFALVGGESIQGDGIFELTRTGSGIRAQKQLPNGLLVIKEFLPGSNYLMRVTTRLENQSTQSVALPQQKLIVGTATPMSARATFREQASACRARHHRSLRRDRAMSCGLPCTISSSRWRRFRGNPRWTRWPGKCRCRRPRPRKSRPTRV